jgi:hypothetical protein
MESATRRITVPAPPSVEALRIASSFPPAAAEDAGSTPRDTIPAPPPSDTDTSLRCDDEESPPSTLPNPPSSPASKPPKG